MPRLMQCLSILDRKLVRDLVRLWPQAFAIAMVLAAGVATLILAVGAHRSLAETRSAYYERHRFADIFATAKRVPAHIGAKALELPGVAVAEARIVQPALLDIEGMAEPATGVAISVPDHAEPRLNRIYLRQGRMPEPGRAGEVTVNEAFAVAHGFTIGARFSAVLNGRRRELAIVGIAHSPEFIYAIGPGDLMPDNRRFAVLWMSESVLAGLYDLDGAFNSITLKLQPGAREAEVIGHLDNLLARYGGTGAHGRSDHLSHAFLDAELRQLQALARIIPPIFLLVSAFLINMTLRRLIALEREQIGLLKAIGYGRLPIAAHYLKPVLAIAAVGIAIGFGLGTWLGAGLTRLYGRFFQFPFLVFERDADVYLIAAGVSSAAAVGGALRATREALRLPPAVAMQPPSPPRFRRIWGERRGLYACLSQMTMMSLRNMVRWPMRAGLTALGLSLSVALLVVSLFAFDSVEAMIDVTFFRSERQQATINFTEKRPARAIGAVLQLPGVLRAEPYRGVAARIRNGHVWRRISLIGKPADARLSRPLDRAHEPVALPAAGLLINRRLADVLGLGRGDMAEVEVLDERRVRRLVPVSDVIESYFGLVVWMRDDALAGLLEEPPLVSGVHIAYDRGAETELYQSIKRTPAVASMALQRTSLKRFRETLAENINLMTSVYISLSVVVAFGVIYNSARVQLSERARDLASLRVLGFTRGEVSRVLLTELALPSLLAQPLGWLLGYAFGWLTIQSFSSDLYTTPLVIERATYAKASLVVAAAALVSALIVRRRVDRLDLIAVLKARD
jgi:putative ABC transport system permease protein